MIPTWLGELYKFVSDHSSHGRQRIDDVAMRTAVRAELKNHTDEIKDILLSPEMTRDQFLKTIICCLDGYAASSQSRDTILPEAEDFIRKELRPTIAEDYRVRRYLRFERQNCDKYAPTLKTVRDAYEDARRHSNCVIYMLQSINLMMDGKPAIAIGNNTPSSEEVGFVLEHSTAPEPMMLEHHH